MSMYRCDDLCLSNEDLALRIQDGDPQAAPLLLSQNEGYLTMLAASYCAQFSQDFLVDDLKQEGALALLDAARRYDPSMGTKLLTYATHEGDIETDLLPAIQEKLTVSAKVARRLLEEYRTVFQVECLGEGVFDLGYGGDPARAYNRSMRRTLLLQRMGEVLSPRELNLVCCYLGIGQPNEQGMTFQELAIRLNYNGPSGAEKTYKSAIRKLRKQLKGGAYGQWLSIQKAIHKARADAEADSGYYVPPQTTWLDEKELAERFLCEVISLIHVHEIFSDTLKQETE